MSGNQDDRVVNIMVDWITNASHFDLFFLDVHVWKCCGNFLTMQMLALVFYGNYIISEYFMFDQCNVL